jgi:hypothetical protein
MEKPSVVRGFLRLVYASCEKSGGIGTLRQKIFGLKHSVVNLLSLGVLFVSIMVGSLQDVFLET